MAISSATKKLLVLFFIFAVYLTLGMLIFVAIEGGEDKWGYGDGFRFAVQVVTTIGYGDSTPVTTAGKIFSIFYAMFGIPIAVLFLQAVGEEILKLQHRLVKRGRQTEPSYMNEKCVASSMFFLLIIIFAGAVVQMEVEGWSFVDGVYCYFITFTTIGFGDLIPGSKNTVMRVFQPFYIILGLAVVANVLNGLAGCKHSFAALKNLCRCGRRGKASPQGNVVMDVRSTGDEM